jgi:lysophospholipase L1-like esterase
MAEPLAIAGEIAWRISIKSFFVIYPGSRKPISQLANKRGRGVTTSNSERPIMRAAVAAILLLITGSVFAASKIDVEADLLQTLTPVPPPTDRYQTYLKEAALAQSNVSTDVILIGDSLAEQWEQRLWSPLRVFNLGVSGDRTQNVLWRLSANDWTKISTEKIVIILGTNNLGSDQPYAIIAGLEAVVKKSSSLWPKASITYLEIPPRGSAFKHYTAKRKQVNEAMRREIKTVNADDAITCHWKLPCANYQPDLLHLTPEGYSVILQAFR